MGGPCFSFCGTPVTFKAEETTPKTPTDGAKMSSYDQQRQEEQKVNQYARKLMAFDGQELRASEALHEIDTTPDHFEPDDNNRVRLMLGAQVALARLGYKVTKSGYADTITARALVSVIGPRWRTWSWREIYRALEEASH